MPGLDRNSTVNAYHNLSGWLRDVRACLDDLRDSDRAGTNLAMLNDLLQEVMEMFDDYRSDDDEPEADELVGEDAYDDVDVPGPRDSGGPGTVRRRDAPRRVVPVGRLTSVGDVLPRNLPEEGGSGRSDAARVARTKKGVKRGKK